MTFKSFSNPNLCCFKAVFLIMVITEGISLARSFRMGLVWVSMMRSRLGVKIVIQIWEVK